MPTSFTTIITANEEFDAQKSRITIADMPSALFSYMTLGYPVAVHFPLPRVPEENLCT